MAELQIKKSQCRFIWQAGLNLHKRDSIETLVYEMSCLELSISRQLFCFLYVDKVLKTVGKSCAKILQHRYLDIYKLKISKIPFMKIKYLL